MVSETVNSRHRTRKQPEKAMCRKIQAMMALRTAAMADNAVSDAMGNVFAPDRTQLHQPVPIVLPEDTLQALRRILRQEDNAALHGVQSVQRCRLDNLELGIMCTATERVNDARVRFKRCITASRYGEIQQLLFVPLAVAQGKSGFVAVVRYHCRDSQILRHGSRSNTYNRLTNGDINMQCVREPPTSAAGDWRIMCVFVEDIECKVAFIEMDDMAATGRRWAVLDGPPA